MPSILTFLEEIQRLEREVEELKVWVAKLRDALEGLVEDLDELITQSGGVYGLHLNGDPAPWSDLLAGGKYEEWLCQLEEAKLVVWALEGRFPKKEVENDG